MNKNENQEVTPVRKPLLKKTIITLVISVITLVCGVWFSQPVLICIGTSTTTSELITTYPDSRMYLLVAADVLRAAADGSKTEPEAIKALLHEKLQDTANPAMIDAIISGVMNLVHSAYKKYDTQEQHAEVLKQIADGITIGAK